MSKEDTTSIDEQIESILEDAITRAIKDVRDYSEIMTTCTAKIKALIATQVQEAYKKGYIDGGIATPTPATGNELKLISGSGPVYGDLYRQAVELVGKPPKGEISLQRLDGTNVYQWHYRIAVFWEPWGQQMYIEQPKLAAQNNATYEAVLEVIGDDEQELVMVKNASGGETPISHASRRYENKLRTEQRKRAKELFGEEQL